MLEHASELEVADRPTRRERRYIDRANQVAEETSPVLVRWRYWLES